MSNQVQSNQIYSIIQVLGKLATKYSKDNSDTPLEPSVNAQSCLPDSETRHQASLTRVLLKNDDSVSIDIGKCNQILDIVAQDKSLSKDAKSLIFLMGLATYGIDIKRSEKGSMPFYQALDFVVTNREKIKETFPDFFQGEFPSTMHEAFLKFNSIFLQQKSVNPGELLQNMNFLQGKSEAELIGLVSEVLDHAENNQVVREMLADFDGKYPISKLLKSLTLEKLEEIIPKIADKIEENKDQTNRINVLVRGVLAANSSFLKGVEGLVLDKTLLPKILPKVVTKDVFESEMKKAFPNLGGGVSENCAGGYSPYSNFVMLNLDMLGVYKDTSLPEEMAAHEAATHAIEAWARTLLPDSKKHEAGVERVKTDLREPGEEILGPNGFFEVPTFASVELRDKVEKFILEIIEGGHQDKIVKTSSDTIPNFKAPGMDFESTKLNEKGQEFLDLLLADGNFVEQFNFDGDKQSAYKAAKEALKETIEGCVFRYEFTVGKHFNGQMAHPHISSKTLESLGINPKKVTLTFEGEALGFRSSVDAIEILEYQVGMSSSPIGIKKYRKCSEEMRAQESQARYGYEVAGKSEEILKLKMPINGDLFVEMSPKINRAEKEEALVIISGRNNASAIMRESRRESSELPHDVELVKTANKLKNLKKEFTDIDCKILDLCNSLMSEIKSKYKSNEGTYIIHSVNEQIVEQATNAGNYTLDKKIGNHELNEKNEDTLTEKDIRKMSEFIELMLADNLPEKLSDAQGRNSALEKVFKLKESIEAMDHGVSRKPRLSDETEKEVKLLKDLIDKQKVIIDQINEIKKTHGLKILDPVFTLKTDSEKARSVQDDYLLASAVFEETQGIVQSMQSDIEVIGFLSSKENK